MLVRWHAVFGWDEITHLLGFGGCMNALGGKQWCSGGLFTLCTNGVLAVMEIPAKLAGSLLMSNAHN
jgi:hypothetical protein